MPENRIPKLDKTNLWDQSYSILKKMIIQRSFPPNHKLSLPELSKQLGVSRTPIRDALNRLEAEGLVRTVSKVGTFVNAITEEFIIDVMDTRMMIEFWVADMIPDLPKEQVIDTIERMKSILADSVKLIQSRKFPALKLSENNLQFHLLYVKLDGNKFNVQIYKEAMNYRSIAIETELISKEMIEAAYTQHERFITAIQAGDPDKIKKILKLHLIDSKKRLIDNIKRNGGEL